MLKLGGRRLQERLIVSNLGLLIGMIVLFSVASPGFLSVRGIIAIQLTLVPILLLAVGETFVLMARSFDLSIGSIYILTSVFTALFASQLGPVAILVGPATGAIFGLMNGMVFKFGRIPSFIATLATMIIYQGVAQIVVTGQYYLFATEESFRAIAISFVASVIPLKIGRDRGGLAIGVPKRRGQIPGDREPVHDGEKLIEAGMGVAKAEPDADRAVLQGVLPPHNREAPPPSHTPSSCPLSRQRQSPGRRSPEGQADHTGPSLAR